MADPSAKSAKKTPLSRLSRYRQKQGGFISLGWTYGILANHLWSFAGDSDRSEINTTFLQPFLSYTTPTQMTFGLNTESTYDWVNSQWTVPVQLSVAQLVKMGSQPVQFTLGGRYWVEGPDSAPEWGIRFTMTLLFPK